MRNKEFADECVAAMAEKHVNSVVDSSEVPRAEGQEKEKVPFSVKSISVQSVTMSEFFYRCSTDFPQLEFGNKKEKETCRLFFGQGFNLDEAYEWLESLSLLGCPGENKGRGTSMNSHASTLNTLLARGKTKRATRTSGSYEGKATQHVSVSILGNAHPSRILLMERGLQGQHTAATRERFMICVDESVARHESLPKSMLETDPDLPAFTWLPLTNLQARIFKFDSLLNNPSFFDTREEEVEDENDPPEEGYPVTLPDGVASRVRYVPKIDEQGRKLKNKCLSHVVKFFCCVSSSLLMFFSTCHGHMSIPLQYLFYNVCLKH